MNELINIKGTNINVKEYKGQRVVTFTDIDRVHQRPEGTARRNFSANKNHFVEGEDYFVVTPTDLANTELHEFRTNGIEVSSPRGMALITEQGYLMLVKSFTDDLAWDVQRSLVNSYFKTNNIASDLSPQMQLLVGMVNQLAETERQVRETREIAERAANAADAIKEAVLPITDNWRQVTNDKIKAITKRACRPYDELRNEMYQLLEQRAGCDLSTRVRNMRARVQNQGGTKTAIDKICKIDVIESDKKLKEIFSKIVAEYEIKYCA